MRRRPIGAFTSADLGPEADALIADWDACWIDGAPIADLAAWRRVVQAGRLAEVDGAFALAWRSEGTILLARDPIGHRSLYYAQTSSGAVFGSALPAILRAAALERQVHLPSVAAYLSYAYVPGRQTLAQGVFEVLPGEVVRLAGRELHPSSFWSLPSEPAAAEPEAELTARLRAALEAAVRRDLEAPGERVGAFLSGGLDSSAIVALIRRLHPGPCSTYSVHFGAGLANELAFSSQVAAHCNTDHRVVEVTPEMIRGAFDRTVAALSEPNGDPLTVPNLILFRRAAEETGVILNGEGGDPCFGGPKNVPMILAELLGDPAASADPLRARAESYLRAHQKCFDELAEVLDPEVLAAAGPTSLVDALVPRFGDPRWTTLLNTLMAINVSFKGAHHILPKVDQLSSAAGVVARSPLFDRRVVELAFAIPPALKRSASVEKYLLKRAVADLLPASIIERPKSGMLVPVEHWFAAGKVRGPLYGFARERLLDSGWMRRLFRRAYLERLIEGRLGGLRPRRGIKIWLLLTLESWLRGVLEPAHVAP
jgi:asparagine synthase (glutamine-hydrolysing)